MQIPIGIEESAKAILVVFVRFVLSEVQTMSGKDFQFGLRMEATGNLNSGRSKDDAAV